MRLTEKGAANATGRSHVRRIAGCIVDAIGESYHCHFDSSPVQPLEYIPGRVN